MRARFVVLHRASTMGIVCLFPFWCVLFPWCFPFPEWCFLCPQVFMFLQVFSVAPSGVFFAKVFLVPGNAVKVFFVPGKSVILCARWLLAVR